MPPFLRIDCCISLDITPLLSTTGILFRTPAIVLATFSAVAPKSLRFLIEADVSIGLRLTPSMASLNIFNNLLVPSIALPKVSVASLFSSVFCVKRACATARPFSTPFNSRY